MENNNKVINKRCKICHKKINLIYFKCKCDDVFCSTHKYKEEHNCNYNYKIIYDKEIKNNLGGGIFNKVLKI